MDVPRRRIARRRWPWLALAATLVLAAVSVWIARLAQAPPVVSRASLWIDRVERGDFVRQVSGPGTLVPEEVRQVTARTAGRVERLLVEPGSSVDTETLLVELSNPDLELARLEAARQHKSAEAKLVDLRATLESDRLQLRAELARTRAEYQDAQRRADANERLSELEMVGSLEYERSRERAAELGERIRLQEQRLGFLGRSTEARVAAQRADVERLGALAQHRGEMVASLRVQATTEGVLQELPLEVGQRVSPGDLLAKVVAPDRLKAELRIPEGQARQVQLGQAAEIDTRSAVARGRVVRIDPAVVRGTVTVDVAFTDGPPPGARPDLSVDGRIELERLDDVLFTGRPAFASANGRVSLFRVTEDGDAAERVAVELGGQSASHVEIRSGLAEGDRVVLSDTSEWDAVDRLTLD